MNRLVYVCSLLLLAVGCAPDWSASPKDARDSGLSTDSQNAGRGGDGKGDSSLGDGSTRGDAGPRGASGGDGDPTGGGGGDPTVNNNGEDGAQSGTCSTEDEQRCVSAGNAARETCQKGSWTPSEPCESGKICVAAADSGATCKTLLEVCNGAEGRWVCSGKTMHACNVPNAKETQLECESEQQCELGREEGACATCIPKAFRCTDASLEQCAEDGKSWALSTKCSSAKLCNAKAGACTANACVAGSADCMGDQLLQCNADLTAFEPKEPCMPGLCDKAGKQCDSCKANAVSCAGDAVVSCSADGQKQTSVPCPTAKPHCAGAGACVQCTKDDDCPAVKNPCVRTSCNVMAGTCGTTPVAAHMECETGVCDGKGACIGCVNGSDCPASMSQCSGGKCVECTTALQCNVAAREMCEKNACVVGPYCGDKIVQSGEECDDGNSVNTDSCVSCKMAHCGDKLVQAGVEECDQGPSNTRDCSSTCKKSKLYQACNGAADCGTANFETCASPMSLCTRLCSSTADCPQPPTGTAKCYSNYCMQTCAPASGQCGTAGLVCAPNNFADDPTLGNNWLCFGANAELP